MNITTKVTLLFFAILSNIVPSVGQTASDKIIFLTDYYETFIDEVDANDKQVKSLYKEKVQLPIFNKYFQKSEYTDIVKSFLTSPVKNTAELKESIDRIAINQVTIENKIVAALKESRKYINNDNLTVFVIPVNPNLRQIIEGMSGVMGLTAGSKQIILTIEPAVIGWEQMLEYAIAHEFNHAYWTDLNFEKSPKWTLLDYLVFEGRGDYFAHLLYPNVNSPWTMALADNLMLDLWNKVKPNLQSEDMGYQMEVMFGSSNYPVWGGYSLGFDIVRSALENNKDLKTDDWTTIGSVEILEQSKYK